MPRRPRPPRSEPPKRPSTRPSIGANSDSSTSAGARRDQLVQLCDYCNSAHRIADAQGEKLLAYLLAMAIQEGQTALRRLTTAQAALPSE